MLSLAYASCSVTTQSCSIHYSEFSTSCPNSQFVVRLYQFIITFPGAILCTLLHRENTSFEMWNLQKARVRGVPAVCAVQKMELLKCVEAGLRGTRKLLDSCSREMTERHQDFGSGSLRWQTACEYFSEEFSVGGRERRQQLMLSPMVSFVVLPLSRQLVSDDAMQEVEDSKCAQTRTGVWPSGKRSRFGRRDASTNGIVGKCLSVHVQKERAAS